MSGLVGCKYCGDTMYNSQIVYKDCHIRVLTIRCRSCLEMPTKSIELNATLDSDEAYKECESVWKLLNKKT